MAAVCDYTKPPYCDYTFAAYLARRRGLPVAGGRDPAAAPTAANQFFSVDLGMVHLVVLQAYCPDMKNTSAQPCLAAGSPQAVWLAKDLAGVNRSRTPWVVAAWHQPWVNSNTAHAIAKEGVPIQNALEPLLVAAGGLDLALSGHVHGARFAAARKRLRGGALASITTTPTPPHHTHAAYERSCSNVNFVCGAENGTTYITIGDGGNREGLAATWVGPQPAWSAYRNASFGHGELWAPNATHLRWEWVPNDALRGVGDALWIIKGVGALEDRKGRRTALG